MKILMCHNSINKTRREIILTKWLNYSHLWSSEWPHSVIPDNGNTLQCSKQWSFALFMGWNIGLWCFIVWLQLAVVNSHRYECRRVEGGAPPTTTLPCVFLHLSQIKPGGALRCFPVFRVASLIGKMTNLLFGLVGAMFYVASGNTVGGSLYVCASTVFPHVSAASETLTHVKGDVCCDVSCASISTTIVRIHTSTGEELQLLLSWRYNSSSCNYPAGFAQSHALCSAGGNVAWRLNWWYG